MAANNFVYWSDGLGGQAFVHHSWALQGFLATGDTRQSENVVTDHFQSADK